MIVCNFMGTTEIWIADPDIAQDIFVSKNAILDKHPEGFLMFKDIIGSSFIFGHNDDTWKMKRKACAHAFYKDRLDYMLETLKSKLVDIFTEWG